MILLYRALVTIHILSAVLGMGPGFIMIYIVTKATNMVELRHAYVIRNRVHVFVMVGGSLLLLTGLAMGAIMPFLFEQGWFVLSLILFLVALGFGPVILSPKSKPIKKLLETYEGEEIPEEYYKLSKSLFFYERLENLLFVIVIFLMILRPF